jgi:hypothetical protein
MPLLAFIRRSALSLAAGALFGLAIATSAPVPHSAAAGAGAAAFIYVAYHRFDRSERRAAAQTEVEAEQPAGDD